MSNAIISASAISCSGISGSGSSGSGSGRSMRGNISFMCGRRSRGIDVGVAVSVNAVLDIAGLGIAVLDIALSCVDVVSDVIVLPPLLLLLLLLMYVCCCCCSCQLNKLQYWPKVLTGLGTGI